MTVVDGNLVKVNFFVLTFTIEAGIKLIDEQVLSFLPAWFVKGHNERR